MTHSLRLIVGLLSLLLATDAVAHRFAPSLLKVVESSEGEFNVLWKTPTQTTSNVPLRPVWPDNCEVRRQSPVIREGTGNLSTWTLGCDDFVGQIIGVSGLAQNQASAMVMVSLLDGRHYQRVVNEAHPNFEVPAAPDKSKVMVEYPVLGMEHIWGGLDHLMFVFGLLLLVGGGARLLWTITAFTVGHSITLAMVTLGLFTYPVSLVEFAIALSIFVLALELSRNVGDLKGLLRQHPWWLAGGFGLLHGMGFAGALAEIGLPQNNVPLALLFFNIGIEIGQIGFVLILLALWWLVRRAAIVQPERLLPVPVYLLGGLSAMWCIERGLELLG